MVSIGPEGHHDHPTGDPCSLASSRLPPVLALEISLSWRPTEDRRGPARVDPADERGKSVVGSTTRTRPLTANAPTPRVRRRCSARSSTLDIRQPQREAPPQRIRTHGGNVLAVPRAFEPFACRSD